MLPQITAVVGSIKTSIEIVKGINSLASEVQKNQAIIDIQRNLVEVQGSMLDLQSLIAEKDKVIEELREKISKKEDWKKISSKYELKQFNETFVYALKREFKAEEPVHILCSSCFEKNVKSVLQGRGLGGRYGQDFVCVVCNAEFQHIPQEVAGGTNAFNNSINLKPRNSYSKYSWMGR